MMDIRIVGPQQLFQCLLFQLVVVVFVIVILLVVCLIYMRRRRQNNWTFIVTQRKGPRILIARGTCNTTTVPHRLLLVIILQFHQEVINQLLLMTTLLHHLPSDVPSDPPLKYTVFLVYPLMMYLCNCTVILLILFVVVPGQAMQLIPVQHLQNTDSCSSNAYGLEATIHSACPKRKKNSMIKHDYMHATTYANHITITYSQLQFDNLQSPDPLYRKVAAIRRCSDITLFIKSHCSARLCV